MRTAIAPHELLPKGLDLEGLSIETGRVSISVSSGTSRSVCPLCGRGSSRVHSRFCGLMGPRLAPIWTFHTVSPHTPVNKGKREGRSC